MKKLQINLPEKFVQWLSSLPPVHLVAFKKNEWQFYTLDELEEPIRIDKFKATNATQLSAFVELHRSLGATAADGPKNTEFAFDRLAKCIAVAVDNEDILFTDPNDAFSMWIFQPEDVEVRSLKCDILALIEKAKVEDLDDDDDD